jgi:hypothetical protein
MSTLNFDSPSVQSYLAILQGVITRMASNSASAKSWCVALVSAIVVIISDKGNPTYVWISSVPIVLFFFLDAYYLGLERLFRDVYNGFIRKLHAGTATIEDVFIIAPGGIGAVLRSAGAASLSLSIWPFYGLLVVMLLLVKCWVLR